MLRNLSVLPLHPNTPAIPLAEAARKKRKKDKLARSYLLNNISNPLFDLLVISNLQRSYEPNWRRTRVQIML